MLADEHRETLAQLATFMCAACNREHDAQQRALTTWRGLAGKLTRQQRTELWRNWHLYVEGAPVASFEYAWERTRNQISLRRTRT